jgi:nitroreductase
MNVIDSIKTRRSIRKFLDKEIPRETLEKIIEMGCRAPSSVNSQPWEFTILTGDALAELKRRNLEKLAQSAPSEIELSTSAWPKDSIFRERQVKIAKQLFRLMDIEREDEEKRAEWIKRGFRYFDAPQAIIISYDKALSEYGPLMDLGMVIQSICLLAVENGLGTCIAEQGVFYSSNVREIARISDQKRLAISIAIGYPDWDFPANAVISEREHPEKTISWINNINTKEV